MSENPYESPKAPCEGKAKAPSPIRQRANPAAGCILSILAIPAAAIAGGTVCTRAALVAPARLEFSVPVGTVLGLIVISAMLVGLHGLLRRARGDQVERPSFVGAIIGLSLAAPVAMFVPWRVLMVLMESELAGEWIIEYGAYILGVSRFAILSFGFWLGLRWRWIWDTLSDPRLWEK